MLTFKQLRFLLLILYYTLVISSYHIFPAQILYSLEHINKNYYGPILRLRCGDDNAAEDFYITQNHGELLTLNNKNISTRFSECLILPSACTISSNITCEKVILHVVVWYDQSGNNRNAIQQEKKLQPEYSINSRSLFFNNHSFMHIENAYLPRENYSFIIKHGNIEGAMGGFFSIGTAKKGEAIAFRRFEGKEMSYRESWFADPHDFGLYSPYNIISEVYNGTHRQAYINGTLISTISSKRQLSSDFMPERGYLGKLAYCDGLDTSLNGELFYFIVTENVIDYIVPKSDDRECLSPYIFIEELKSCYMLLRDDKIDYKEAARSCRSYSNGYILDIEDQFELDIITRLWPNSWVDVKDKLKHENNLNNDHVNNCIITDHQNLTATSCTSKYFVICENIPTHESTGFGTLSAYHNWKKNIINTSSIEIAEPLCDEQQSVLSIEWIYQTGSIMQAVLAAKHNFDKDITEALEVILELGYIYIHIDKSRKMKDFFLVPPIYSYWLKERLPLFLSFITDSLQNLTCAKRKNEFLFHGYFTLYDGWREHTEPLLSKSAYKLIPIDEIKNKFVGVGSAGEPGRFIPSTINIIDCYPLLNSSVLAFGRHKDDESVVLLPDTDFIKTRGYSFIKNIVDSSDILWTEKRNQIVWRGGNHGIGYLANYFDDNIEINGVGNRLLNQRELFFKIVAADPFLSEYVNARFSYSTENMMTIQDMLIYKYQIDIDGEVNAWSALWWKLYSGSVVFKVNSHFEQWYYDELIPWMHYIPILANLSDLSDKLLWAMSHDFECEKIANNGKLYISRKTYENVIKNFRF